MGERPPDTRLILRSVADEVLGGQRNRELDELR